MRAAVHELPCDPPLLGGQCNGEDHITPSRAALRDFNPAYVGSGSFTSLWLLRSTGRMSASHPKAGQLYSITSSASAISLSGMLRPSALAVVLLMISSNLVGCSTGRSAGLAPLRIRPA